MKRRELSPAERVQFDIRAMLERKQWLLTNKRMEIEAELQAFRQEIRRRDVDDERDAKRFGAFAAGNE